ncbi:hypothetical protein RDI86_02210 [Cellulosimicrobium sp. XJ-DQ-B-000]|uniref:hypothetical protein n=1 Tax=Cellulosimicrobium sp. XJ-DQ-B-000 TaxID=3072182 RepID=UPI0028069566|nr:hypothetical protein [Cellulosimicrobium sp. XJ-DQ-B-000]MDQ8040655.1 hypothetical protein [Cellulosimicrobium sp. XJ-DQ-B-000]
MTDTLHALMRDVDGRPFPCSTPGCQVCTPIHVPEHYEYGLFKRSNGHQVGGPVRVRAAADPRIRGLKPERYIVRRRAVYTGPWEDA